jgi:F-type H+-transporting ATPase subunit delta
MNPVERSYAKALYEYAAGKGAADEVGEGLGRIAGMIDAEPELRKLLKTETVAARRKEAVVLAILEATGEREDVESFVRILLRKRRMGSLQGVLKAYRELANEGSGGLLLRIRSAMPLPAATLSAIERRFAKAYGRERVMTELEIAPSILGGVIVRVGDTEYDWSLAGRLGRLAGKLHAILPEGEMHEHQT